MTKLYNNLVLIALALTVVFWALPSVDNKWLSDEALELLTANGWGSFIPNPEFLYWPLLVFWVIVSVGLLKRIRIFRSIYFGGVVFFVMASFGWGFVVHTPIEAGLSGIINILDGAILTLSYLSSVATEFKISPNNSPQPTPKNGAAEL